MLEIQRIDDGNILDRKHQTGEQKDEQEAAERDGLNGRRLIGNRAADHGAESGDAKGVENGGDEEGRGISGEVQTEVGEEQNQVRATIRRWR